MALMIPFHSARKGLIEIPHRLPMEQVPGLVGGEIEQSGLVNGMRVGLVLPSAGPMFEGFVDDVCDATVGTERGAKIKGAAESVSYTHLDVYKRQTFV